MACFYKDPLVSASWGCLAQDTSSPLSGGLPSSVPLYPTLLCSMLTGTLSGLNLPPPCTLALSVFPSLCSLVFLPCHICTHTLSLHFCLFVPFPPYFGQSKQNTHLQQSSDIHPEHLPHAWACLEQDILTPTPLPSFKGNTPLSRTLHAQPYLWMAAPTE